MHTRKHLIISAGKNYRICFCFLCFFLLYVIFIYLLLFDFYQLYSFYVVLSIYSFIDLFIYLFIYLLFGWQLRYNTVIRLEFCELMNTYHQTIHVHTPYLPSTYSSLYVLRTYRIVQTSCGIWRGSSARIR